MLNILKKKTVWVPKGWGGEKWLVNNDLYCGKILFFVDGAKCSFHYHKIKQETFIVQRGKVLLLHSGDSQFLERNKDQVAKEILFAEYNRLSGSEGIFHSILRIDYCILEEGDSFDVPPGLVHQIIALKESEILEVSTHHEDSDSFRITLGN